MKNHSISALAALIFSSTPLVAATTIGVNFNNNDTAGGQTDGNFSATWTNVNAGASGSGLSVNGTGGAVTVGWASSNYWSAGSWMSTTSGNAFNTPIGLMRVYLDDGDAPVAGAPAGMGAVGGDGIGASVSLVGMAGWLAAEGATAYTIRAFFSTDTGSATFRQITARNGAAVTSPALETITPTVQGNGLWDGTTVDAGGNISAGTRGDAVFATAFTQDSITLTLPSRNGSDRGTLAGFVVTAIPEPTSALLGCFALPLLLRRRR